MKAIVLTMIMTFVAICASAQFFISCDQRTYCKWNDDTQKYDECETCTQLNQKIGNIVEQRIFQ
jgi:hypothetical protein